jgi:hypothetical protein
MMVTYVMKHNEEELVLVTVVRRLLLSTSVSLPLAAAMLAFVRLAYLSSPPLQVRGRDTFREEGG